MKTLIWLALPILFLAIYFVVPQFKSQPKAESKPSVTQVEKPGPTSPVEPVSISVAPTAPLPGEPAKVTLSGLDSISKVKSLTFSGKPLAVFEEEDKLIALIGLDFHEKLGSYPLVLTLGDDQKIESNIEVGKRELISTDFDIPEQLGGNTPQAEHDLTTTLSQDATILDSITTVISPEKLWNGEFRLPLDGTITVTDTYGHRRQTGSVGLSHLGTDFRAPEGTSVYAMNSGKVVFADSLRNFGRTAIVDHGLGVMTLYMHLSEIKVQASDRVEKGDLVAKSGNTGYSLGPHLHLSVRIGGLSIDPEKFLELMGTITE